MFQQLVPRVVAWSQALVPRVVAWSQALWARIHVPKWLASWAASAAVVFAGSLQDSLSAAGFNPLSLLTWKLAAKTAIGTVIVKTVLWLIGKRRPTPDAPGAPASPTPGV